MENTFLMEAIRRKLKAMSPAQQKVWLSRVKAPDWSFPYTKERAYARYISSQLKPLVTIVNNFIASNLKYIVNKDARADSADKVVSHKDEDTTWSGLLDDQMTSWTAKNFEGETTVIIGIGQAADAVLDFNRAQWLAQTKGIVGIELSTSELWYRDMKTRWVEQNARLMKKAADDYRARVQDIVERGVINGSHRTVIQAQLRQAGLALTDTRARLLARDQIGKLNGMIQQAQMGEAGMTMYTWRTANDERVRGRPGGRWANARPSHWEMEGKLCRWDNAMLYSRDRGATWISRPLSAVQEHPGQAIQCRCTAIPYWNELIGRAQEAA